MGIRLPFHRRLKVNPAYARMLKLRTLLYNLPGADNDFGTALCQEIRSDDQQKVIDFLEANPHADMDAVLDFVTKEIFQRYEAR